jgi:hypothetical protein|tara:strand:- start:147 stop:449 length:303 start_codon:yes stop_codon:yes gene_type:complete
MAIQVNNISGSTAVELIDINSGINKINSMTIANTYSSAIAIDLYLKNAGGTDYYIFKSLSIPTGQTLKLESDEVSFDNTIYNFYIKMGGGSDTASVIIKY